MLSQNRSQARVKNLAQGEGRKVRLNEEDPLARLTKDARRPRKQQGSFFQRVVMPLLERIAAPGSFVVRNANLDEVRMQLMRAGFPNGMTATGFVALKNLILPASLAIVFVAWVPLLESIFGSMMPFAISALLAASVGAIYGYFLPSFWLNMVTRRRQQEIQLVLPDMIDLITVSVEAGLSLYGAIQRISARFDNPLSEEFKRAMQEVRLGRSNIESMRDLARRVDVDDLSTLISAIVQADMLGLAIANVLRVQSERLREKRSQRAREAAQKAPIKMVIPLVFFIFPALFIVILGPAFIKILESGLG
jgi:tight adherence protein C